MAFALETSRERCLVTGMDEYITKPVRGKELEDALKRFQ
jgi:CheY-like chemotaxis protein